MYTNNSSQNDSTIFLKKYKDILRFAYVKLSDEDKNNIRAAFELVLEAHKDQKRKSGEEYIFHPLEVAQIVSEKIGLGGTAITAALLHDVVEDTDISLEEIKEKFGEKVAEIVDGLTKISKVTKKHTSSQIENYRKMLLTLSSDIRVILIKLADRLHNMQTLDAMSPLKQKEKSSEVIEVFVPIAHRLGLYKIKTELEELAFKYLDPASYSFLQEKEKETKAEQEKYIADFSEKIKEILQPLNIEYSIQGRPKTLYSIKKKMDAQGIGYEEIYDKYGIRIIFKSEKKSEKMKAFEIYSTITEDFQPNPTRFRDWISIPKSTGYEALHVTILGMESKWVEIQIRSDRMHEIAEKGYAAHYKYKNPTEKSTLDTWLNKLRENIENPSSSSLDFFNNFKLDLYIDDIFVYTPKGILISLPKYSTGLDFAYAVHTKLGNHCTAVKINGKLSPINENLKSGDTVNVITSVEQEPQKNWLFHVKTRKAQTLIKTFLKKKKREEINYGEQLLKRKLNFLKIEYNQNIIQKFLNSLSLPNQDELFLKIGDKLISNNQIRSITSKRFFVFSQKSKPKQISKTEKLEEISLKLQGKILFGKEKLTTPFVIEKCCVPTIGDDIFAFQLTNGNIVVHKNNCIKSVALRSKYGERIIDAKFIEPKDKAEGTENEHFISKLEITGLDDFGIISRITDTVSKRMKINIKKLSISENNKRFFCELYVEISTLAQLNDLIKVLGKIKGISKVLRK